MVTVDHPSRSAIRRAALMICARRACLSRSFRSAIRFVASFVAIDRKYSAARINAWRTVKPSAECFASNVALLVLLVKRLFMYNAIPLSLAALLAAAIIAIG